MFREFLILAIVAIVIVNGAENSTQKSTKKERICGRNEYFTKTLAEVACQSVCSKKKPDDCPRLNVPGCICLEGYKRRTPASVCILESDCPAEDQDPVLISDESEESDDPRYQDQDDEDSTESSE